MIVGIIGTPNRDEITLPSRQKKTGWGGIIYNILPLSHYLGSKGKVRPICPVGADLRLEFVQLLQKFPNIETEGLLSLPQKQNRVKLRCISQEEKHETANLYLPPIPLEHIDAQIRDLDFLLLNFTSGRDVEKETLRALRSRFPGRILLDVHSLTLSDPDAHGRRRLRVIRDWQEWLIGMDYIQLTWDEVACLTGESATSIAGLVDVADWLLMNGTRGVIVTQGSRGATYFYADDGGILKEEIPPFPIQTVEDTTGCGDVFSSAFIYRLLQGDPEITAVTFAVKAAALKATFSGIDPWLN